MFKSIIYLRIKKKLSESDKNFTFKSTNENLKKLRKFKKLTLKNIFANEFKVADVRKIHGKSNRRDQCSDCIKY